jgi:hypothetical protein
MQPFYADLDVPLGSLQQWDRSCRVLVCNGSVGTQRQLLTFIQLRRVKVVARHDGRCCNKK